MIDAAALLAHRIPDVHQVVTPRDVAFYALSVGAGQDPMDADDLGLADPDRGPAVLPSIVLVLAHPGFWIADPATGVDAVQVVHGEQGFVLHGPVPVSGAVIGRTRVTGVVDKGPGRGALVYSEKTLEHAGAVFATTTSTTFARGDGGFGGPAGPVRGVHPMPEGAADRVLDLATRPEQALYYRLNGDMNPLHADPAVAARAGFARPILHGLCTMGVVCRALGRMGGALREVALRFSAPVYPGETLRTELWADGSFRATVVERGVVAVNNGRAVFG